MAIYSLPFRGVKRKPTPGPQLREAPVQRFGPRPSVQGARRRDIPEQAAHGRGGADMFEAGTQLLQFAFHSIDDFHAFTGIDFTTGNMFPGGGKANGGLWDFN